MFAFDLLQRIPHRLQELIIGGNHMAAKVELNNRCGAEQGVDEFLVFLRGLEPCSDIPSVALQIREFAVWRLEGIPVDVHPAELPILAQEAVVILHGFDVGNGGIKDAIALELLDVLRN